MAAIPTGYRLAVVAPDGTIVDTIDLEGADLSKTLGAATVLDEIDSAIASHTA